MPSQAETIAALQGLSPVTTPIDPLAAVKAHGSAVRLSDAIKALAANAPPDYGIDPNVAAAMGNMAAGGLKSILQVPGNVAKGQQPATPGQWSDVDEATRQANTRGEALWGPQTALSMIGGGVPAAERGAVGMAGAMLPGGKVATKTMGELLPHLYPEASSFAKMTPKEYLGMFGSDLPKQLPQDVENVLKPYMQPTPKVGKVPGPGPVQQFAPKEKTFGELYPNDYLPDNPVSKFTHGDIEAGMGNPAFMKFLKNNPSVSSQNISKTPAQLAKEAGQIYPPIDETAISNALAKNPGASIFDVANTHVGGQSSPLSSSMGNAGLEQTFPYAQTFSDISREGGIPYTPLKAGILGKSENLVHGTRVLGNWEAPNKAGASAIGTANDALKLPDDELGVHFGNPKQAQVFSGDWLSHQAAPRQYPVVVATNNPLELPDTGTWHLEDITRALKNANAGELRGKAGFERQPDNPGAYTQISPETKGMFPSHELDQIDSIEGMRDYLQSKGYDSIKYVNKAEDAGANSFIKFTGSPEAKDFVTGVRSPFAAFDPAKIMRPELAAGLAGGTLAAPAIDPNLLKALTGGQTDQQQ